MITTIITGPQGSGKTKLLAHLNKYGVDNVTPETARDVYETAIANGEPVLYVATQHRPEELEIPYDRIINLSEKPEPCSCLDRVKAAVQERGRPDMAEITDVDIQGRYMSFTSLKSGTYTDVKIEGLTLKGKTLRRTVSLYHNFCPWCGQKY